MKNSASEWEEYIYKIVQDNGPASEKPNEK